MTTSHNWLRKYPKDLVAAIIRTAEKQHSQVYIVGGTVRDLLLGILPQDLDLAVNKDCVSFTENLASLSGGTFVLLDADNGVGRERLFYLMLIMELVVLSGKDMLLMLPNSGIVQ
jgi:hypothetical protein